MDTPQDYVMEELGISKHTSVDWHNFVRDVCAEDVLRNPVQLGGYDQNGARRIVEIDESCYFRRKYNRGAVRPSHWVFGAVERDTKRCCLAEVPNRNAATLLPLIQQWIAPGSRVVSDGWAAYNGIGQLAGLDYQHDVVVHADNFVDPNDPTLHTNNIENLWMRAKRKLKRQFGTSRALFPSYLDEFMWRSRHGPNYFAHMLVMVCIGDQYP